MVLDRRLLDVAVEFINKSQPEDVHLQELYDYVEENLELSFNQLSLHKQVLGLSLIHI